MRYSAQLLARAGRMGARHGAVLLLLLGCATGLAQEQQSNAWFTADELNPGLGERPASLNMETPQSTLESLFALGAENRFAAAAHLLDISALEAAQQEARAAELAQRLHDVIDRKIWIDWQQIPDRPDALVSIGDGPVAGATRRDLSIGMLNLNGRPVSVRLRRIKAGESDPVWVFSRQTIENIDALYERYGPSAFEQWLPDVLTENQFNELSYWELIALPLLVTAVALLGFYVRKFFLKVSQRARRDFLRHMLTAVATPVALLLTGLVTYLLFSSVFTFSAPIDAFLTPVVSGLFLLAVFIVLLRILDVFIDQTFAGDIEDIDKPENDGDREIRNNLTATRRIALLLAFSVGAGVIFMQTTFLHTAGMTLIGSAGILTIVFGLAAREALSNIFSSLQITLSKSAKIGDAVLFEGHWCYVERINFTFIQLKSWDERRLIVPVTYFATHPFENWTKKDPTMTKTVELVLHHTADAQALRERFEQFVQEDEDVIDKSDAKVQIIDHSASGLVMRFYADARDPTSAWNMQCRLREAMLQAAAELDEGRKGASLFLPAERELHISENP